MDRKLFVAGTLAASTAGTVAVVARAAPSPSPAASPLPNASPPSENTVTIYRAAAVDETTGQVLLPYQDVNASGSASPAATADQDSGGVLTDIAFEYDFPGHDRIYIQNAGAAESQSIPGLGDVSGHGYLRYTTSGSYVEFYALPDQPSSRGALLSFYEPPDSLGRPGKLLNRIDILAERNDFEARTHYSYDSNPQAQRAFLYGKLYYAIGDDAEAIAELGGVFTIPKDPSQPNDYWNGDARLLYASAFEDMDDVAAAQVFAQRGITVPADQLHQLALAKARSTYAYLVDHPKQFSADVISTARVGLARIARASGDLEDAIRQYDAVLSGTPVAITRRQLVSTRRLALASKNASQSTRDSQFGKGAAQRANAVRKKDGTKVKIPDQQQAKQFTNSRITHDAIADSTARKQLMLAWAKTYDVMWQPLPKSADGVPAVDWNSEDIQTAQLPAGFSLAYARDFCKDPYFVDFTERNGGLLAAWMSTETRIAEAQTDTGTASLTLHLAQSDPSSKKFAYAFSVLYKRPTSTTFDGKLSEATPALQNAIAAFQIEIKAILQAA
jgi:hypothetical protein